VLHFSMARIGGPLNGPRGLGGEVVAAAVVLGALGTMQFDASRAGSNLTHQESPIGQPNCHKSQGISRLILDT
jgi:hypothetical protein